MRFRYGMWVSLASMALAAGSSSAREGYVETRDGRVFEGHLRFESNGVVVVSVERRLREEVSLTNLAGLAFVSRRGEEDFPPAGGRRGAEPGVLPGSWLNADVGDARSGGSAEYRDGAFRVRSSTRRVTGPGEACHFLFQPATEDFEVVARIAKVDGKDSSARAGLMMRESLDPRARQVCASLSAARGGLFQYRLQFNGELAVESVSPMSVPGWLKLKRDGDVFTAFRSRNGRRWEMVNRVTLGMPKEFYAGLAVWSRRGDVSKESVFEYAEAGITVRNRWFTPRAELVSGSFKVGYLAAMDGVTISFEHPPGRESLQLSSVANIRFQPVPPRFVTALSREHPGVLLANGDFIEGECRGLEQGRVTVSSVLFGRVRYDVNGEVLALVLRKRGPPGAWSCEVNLNDGTSWRGRELKIERLGVTLMEPSLGRRFVPLHEISEIRMNLRDTPGSSR